MGNIMAKVVSIEHLILMLLISFRYKDKIRIQQLLPKANINKLSNLIKKFDDEKETLAKRNREILETPRKK